MSEETAQVEQEPKDPTVRNRHRPRRAWKKPFLRAYAQCGNIRQSCELVRIDKAKVLRTRDKDPEFAAEMEAAYDSAVELCEQECYRRAFLGNDVPVYQGGKKVGERREFSDLLAIFFLKAAKPEKYRDKYDLPPGASIDAIAARIVQLEVLLRGPATQELARSEARAITGPIIDAGGRSEEALADLAKARKSMMEQEKGKRLIDIL